MKWCVFVKEYKIDSKWKVNNEEMVPILVSILWSLLQKILWYGPSLKRHHDERILSCGNRIRFQTAEIRSWISHSLCWIILPNMHCDLIINLEYSGTFFLIVGLNLSYRLINGDRIVSASGDQVLMVHGSLKYITANSTVIVTTSRLLGLTLATATGQRMNV